MTWLIVGSSLFAAMVGPFWFWRAYWLFRDPERVSPVGEGLVSPADGFVVYVHEVAAGQVPIVVKKGRQLRLSELQGLPELEQDGILIGVFMTALDVHVNRAPMGGRILRRVYSQPRENRNMGRMFINLLAGRRPIAEECAHLVENERNTIVIEGSAGSCIVTQIADRWVRRILCRVREGDVIERGNRFGGIWLGSQVDVFIPSKTFVPCVAVGMRVRAGETVIAELRQDPS